MNNSVAGDAMAEDCRCGHSLASHDEIAARYCQATATHEHARGCICAEQYAHSAAPQVARSVMSADH